MGVEIKCTACGQESLLKRTPKYDGFRKAGESLTCADCGHEYASEEEVPYTRKQTPRIFDESDAARQVKVFKPHEADHLCRFCRHYVVNPFVQRCSLQGKPVEATDSCARFSKKPVLKD